jgi:hypothetical protein
MHSQNRDLAQSRVDPPASGSFIPNGVREHSDVDCSLRALSAGPFGVIISLVLVGLQSRQAQAIALHDSMVPFRANGGIA